MADQESKRNDSPRTQGPRRNRKPRPKQSEAKKSVGKEPATTQSEAPTVIQENASDAPQNSNTSVATDTNNGKKDAKSRGRKRFTKKKTQRRIEIDELTSKYKVFQIEPELFQVLLTPSDPDFPFDIPVLDFDLHIPRHYPNQGLPWITVTNANIPKGNAINVDNAFKGYEGTIPEKVARLDNDLEKLIAMAPAKTFTIVKPKPKDVKEPKSADPSSQPVKEASEEPKTAELNEKARDTSEELETTEPNGKAKDESEEPETAVSNGKGKVASEEAGAVEEKNDSGSDSDEDSDSSSGSDYEPDYDENYTHPSDEEDIDSGAPKTDMNKPKREGTELIFSDITLTNIALCEIVSLNMLLQCGRCKTMHQFNNLRSADYGKPTKPRAEICSKCDLPLMVAFRKEYLHSMSHSAGYLDIDGGKAADLLPSSYAAMCGQCQQWSPVFKNVDMGAHRMVNCRNCHTKLWIKIELFDFVLLSSSTISAGEKQAQRSKLPASAPKQKLKLTGGEPLENHGTCQHYRKSTRWFRFSCCQRVFACDKCHDLEMQHRAEQVSRMICGYCSREQRFSAKCSYCEHDYTQRVSRFWEGGSGVRDRKLMSRKDKRKYRRDPKEKAKSEGAHFQGKSKPITR